MTPDRRALRHNAFVYESHDEYLACAVPFLKEGLQAGEGAIVAHTKPGMGWRTHPEVVDRDAWTTSELYEEPDRLLRRITPPPEALPDLRSIPVGQDTEHLRERLAHELIAAGHGEGKTLEMLLAATEIATNAIQHGAGIKDVRIGQAHGRFVCEITDRGAGFDDPAAGYLAPRDGVGSGLWVARQLTWRIELFQSPRGFTARIWL